MIILAGLNRPGCGQGSFYFMRMKKCTILLVLLLGYSFGFAQGNNPDHRKVEHAYESFKETFDDEIGIPEEPKVNSRTVSSFGPAAMLPAWFFNFRELYPGRNLVIGISDPGQDSTTAHQQAIVRALALASFAHQSNVQNISDNYYLEKTGSKTLGKFNSFTSFSTQSDLGYDLVESVYTQNREVLVLIEPKTETEIKLNIEARMVLFQSETLGKMATRLSLETDAVIQRDEVIFTSWLLIETGSDFDIVSTWNDEYIALPAIKYKYLSPISHESTNILQYVFDTRYGLWYAYLNAMAANMEQMDVFSSQVKFIDENFDQRFQDLTRVVFSDVISFRLSKILVYDNQLSIFLDKAN